MYRHDGAATEGRPYSYVSNLRVIVGAALRGRPIVTVHGILMLKINVMKPAPIKPPIELDLLERIDIRVGTIELVNDVKGSDKLVKLTVNFGDHTRTIFVGMKQERENPKEIQGRQALFVINLEPKKLMGEISEGMLLDIGYADGLTPVLAVPEQDIPNGARAG